MPEQKKPIGELRKELRKMLIDISIRPSQIKKREDIEHMIGMYGKFAEEKKSTPLPERGVGGRKKAKEVESSPDEMGIVVPKKVVKEKTEYAERKEKKAKKPAAPAHVAEDSGTGSESEEEERVAKKAVAKVAKAAVSPAPEKPKRVITPEHLAKMQAARGIKKAASNPNPNPAEKKAEPKKDDAPPSAPAKAEKRIPVFKNVQ